jgi:hypothetical protein
MTTARDLALITLGMPTDLPVAQGDLSLALAGAEAVDLLENGALSLDGDRMVPGPRVATGDRLLDQADASLTRREPYETVDDRLWRRGSELAAAYVDDLERAGLVTHPRGHGFWLGSARPVLADSQARRGGEERRLSGDPVSPLCWQPQGSGRIRPRPTRASTRTRSRRRWPRSAAR